MKDKKCATLLFVVFILIAFTAGSVNATIQYVDKIELQFFSMSASWYDYVSGSGSSINGKLNFTSSVSQDYLGGSKIYTIGGAYTFDLAITGFIFSPDITNDVSSGTTAQAYFEGDQIVQIVGGIKYTGTNTFAYGGTGAAAEVLFEARMVETNDWLLAESLPYNPGQFDKTLQLEFEVANEGACDGIAIGTTGDILKMVNPKMDLSLKTNIPTADPSNFLADFQSSPMGGGSASNIKITGTVPEPATLTLLLSGLLVGMRRRK